MVFRVVLPTALPGLVTGSLLAVARGAGETAPLLFTAFAVNATTWDLGEQMNSLPIQIFNDVRQAQANIVERAWGAALTLVADDPAADARRPHRSSEGADSHEHRAQETRVDRKSAGSTPSPGRPARRHKARARRA